MIYIIYREVIVNDQIYQKCFLKFCAGDLSLNNAPQSGRLIAIKSRHSLLKSNHCVASTKKKQTSTRLLPYTIHCLNITNNDCRAKWSLLTIP